jgi:hypothetical protein
MAKKVLDELKWHPQKSLKDAKIVYIHRGAPNDELTVTGEEIVRFEKSFFVIERDSRETAIPYHRIKKIISRGKVLWEKRG